VKKAGSYFLRTSIIKLSSGVKQTEDAKCRCVIRLFGKELLLFCVRLSETCPRCRRIPPRRGNEPPGKKNWQNN
jgi:hypothetical protein